MLRFIFVCMGIVAISFIAIGTQFMTTGISNEATNIAARNAKDAAETAEIQAVASQDTITAEDLNAIETTAGTPSYDPNDTFTGGFTNQAPAALQDSEPVIETEPAPAEDN